MNSETQQKIKVRMVEARRIMGKKHVRDKMYSYDYYTLSLNLYVPRNIIEKYGREFVVIKEEGTGVVTIMPKKLAEERGIKVEEKGSK